MSGSTPRTGLSDEARTTLVNFCKSKSLSASDMEELESILDEIANGNPTLAVDARYGSRVTAALENQRARAAERFAARFPNAGHINQGR